MNELSEKNVEHTPENSEQDYRLIEEALLQNPRGRWFLEEFLNRNRPEDTQKLLEAIRRIEQNLEEKNTKPADDIDPIRMSILEMSKAIAKTREEIKSIKPEREEDNQLINASEELSAIVESTESATNTILEAAEEIQEAAWILREAGASDGPCDTIDTKTTDIYTACSFQDITGQRTTKVVQALCYIENRVNAMIDIWGLHESDGTPPREVDTDTRQDAHLLNGPAKLGEGLEQDSIDNMLSAATGLSTEEEGQSLADSLSFDSIDQSDEIADQSVEQSQQNVDDFDFDSIEPQAEESADIEFETGIDFNELLPEVDSTAQIDDAVNSHTYEDQELDQANSLDELAERVAAQIETEDAALINADLSETRPQPKEQLADSSYDNRDDNQAGETESASTAIAEGLKYIKRRCSTQTAALAATMENDIQFEEDHDDFSELASIAESALSDGPLPTEAQKADKIKAELAGNEGRLEIIDLVQPVAVKSLNPALADEPPQQKAVKTASAEEGQPLNEEKIITAASLENLEDLSPEDLSKDQEDALLS